MFTNNKSLISMVLSIFFINSYGARVCDSWWECYKANINAAAVECEAWWACLYADISSSNVTCDAYRACYGSELSGVVDGECGAKQACRYSDITVDGKLSCSAKKSCQQSDVTVSEDASLTCSGYKSCAGFSSDSSYGSPLELYGNIECSGEYSCQNSDTYVRLNSDSSSDDIICNGEYSCYANTYYLDNGLNDEYTITGEAEYALEYGDVFSGENNTLTVTVDGYLAGGNLNVYCESGSTCEIDCEGEACSSTTTILYCASTTTVTTTCDVDCDCDDVDACATIVEWSDYSSGMTTKEKSKLISKEKQLLLSSLNDDDDDDQEQLSNFDMNKYAKHLKFNGNPVSDATLNKYLNSKNSNTGYLWTNNHYTMLFGILITTFTGLILGSIYYCHEKGKKINNFEEYEPVAQN